MSLRDALRLSIIKPEEKCCTVAGYKGSNNATNHGVAETPYATSHATTSTQPNDHVAPDATARATSLQQALKNRATNAQFQTRRAATPIEVAELTMILKVLLFDCEPAEFEEALQAALGDVEEALICFRDLWQQLQSGKPKLHENS